MLTEAVRDLARDRPRRSAVLLATVFILAVAALTSSSSSSKASSSPSSSLSSSPSSLCQTPGSSKQQNQKKNNMGLLGGPTAGNPEESRHAALFAVEKLQANNAFAKQGALSLERLVSAQRQVVAGTNHILVLETKDASGAVKTVHATVWEKLPDNARNGQRDMELTKFQVADGGGPAAEGVEAGAAADCGGGGGGSWEDAAARAAVAGINARSNSLVPYELAAVIEAKRGGAASEMRLRLKRGDKSETFRVSVKEQEEKEGAGGAGIGATAAAAGKFGLVSFAHEP